MTANVPIRLIDGLEIPTTGIWPAHGTSSVVRSSWLRGPRSLPVVGGWFDVAEDPTDSRLRLDLDDCMLFATTKRISAGDDGHTEWHLEGFAQRADRHHPLTLSLRCHGVFCRGADVWAWLSGTGTIRTPAGRLGRLRPLAGDGRLVVELLFTTSDLTDIPDIAPKERSLSVGSRVMKIPSVESQPVAHAGVTFDSSGIFSEPLTS
jgi:hypothetical protein